MKEKPDYCIRTKKARESAGLSVEDIAKAMGIEYQAYWKYENRSMIKTHLLMKFCAITKVRPEWLVDGTGEMNNTQDEWIKEQTEWLRGLNKEGRQAYKDLKSLHEKHFKKG